MKSAFVVALLAAALDIASGYEETSKLTIAQPRELLDYFRNGIEHRQAMFGIPDFRASITGVLEFAPSNDLDGCSPITVVPEWPTDGPLVIMMDRGNCTFVTKVEHAQRVGAQAAIIVDNIDEGSLPYMADDLSGTVINIPSMLIYKADGQVIKDTLATGELVRVTMSWALPHDDNHVEWELWTSSDDETSKTFKAEFIPAAEALGNRALMTPHYFIWPGASSACIPGSDGVLPCDTECTNSGRYCTFNPEDDEETGLSGVQIVSENLRQICIFRAVNATGESTKWWNYVSEFETTCHDAEDPTKWSEACSKTIQASIGVDLDSVDECITGSGGSDPNGGENSIFEQEIFLRNEKGVYFLPSVLVNDAPYHGSMSCPEPVSPESCGVLGVVCAGFQEDSEPVACEPYNGCPVGIELDECGHCGDWSKDECGLCFANDYEYRNKTCLDCAGVPNGDSVLDVCGVCDGPGRDHCGECFDPDDEQYNQACLDCAGVANGGAVLDVCGVCDGPGRDLCGKCFDPDDEQYNQSCLDCNGVVNGPSKLDECNHCDGPGRDICANCYLLDNPLRNDDDLDACVDVSQEALNAAAKDVGGVSVAGVVGIVIASVIVVAGLGFWWSRRRERAMKDDIDALLQQYLPMDSPATSGDGSRMLNGGAADSASGTV